MAQQTPRGVRFPAGADTYGPGGRTRIQIDIDQSAVDLAGVNGATPGITPGNSFLEMTITPSTSETWAPTQLRLTEGGANAFFRNVRLMSKQGGVVFDELTDYNLLWDLLYRSAYDDAQRETLARVIGAQNAYESRSIFNTLPVTDANASTIAPFTARIPLPCLLGLFRLPAIPLAMTKGLTLQIDLETRIPACLVRSTAMPISMPLATRFTPDAVDKTGDAGVTLPIGGDATQTTIQAAFDDEEITNARVVTFTASAAAILIEDVAYTSTSADDPPVMTFGANVGAENDIVGGIVEPRGSNTYTLDEVDASGGGVKTVTTINNLTTAASTIIAGSKVALTLDAISTANPPVITRTRVTATVDSIAAGGGGNTKVVFTLEDDLPSTNFTGGGTIQLDVNYGAAGPLDPGTSTYQLTDVAIVAASLPQTSVPKMVQWVSFASWPTPLAAGSSSIQWPTLPYSRAMALISRISTGNSNATTGTENGLTSYEYLINGEATVEGGPVNLYQYAPLQRTELLEALDAADIPLRRFSSLVDSLPVALRPEGTTGVDTTTSVVQLRVTGASSAGTLSLYVAHVRSMEGGASTLPQVEL